MKKKIWIISAVIALVLVFYTVFNQIDTPAAPLEFSGEGQLAANDYREGNGFFTLWTLTEPEEKDTDSQEVRKPYRALHIMKGADAAIKNFDSEAYKKMGAAFSKRWKKILKSNPGWAYSPRVTGTEWIDAVKKAEREIRLLEKEFSYLLVRYRKMLENPFFRDLTIVRADAPVPNLIAWLRLAKLYNAVNMLDALEGNWDQAVSSLLDQLQSAKKIVKGSRTLIANLVAKAEFRFAAEALAALVNVPECPASVFREILRRTPPLDFFEYGSAPLVFEYRFRPEYTWNRFRTLEKKNFFSALFFTVFTQTNRTRNVRDSLIADIIKSERTEPWQWASDPFAPKRSRQGAFWWLQNPGGKILLHSFMLNDRNSLATVILKSYRCRTVYELLRISAELHLKFSPEKSVAENLKNLETYQLPDPCSGKPYVWNQKKQILYSIGTDRKDNGGRAQSNDITGDFPVQILLYVKNSK